MKLLTILLAALALSTPALASNYGGGGGDYLPACNSNWWGATAQAFGRWWACYYGADHWTLL
jgi:hypothetical protein